MHRRSLVLLVSALVGAACTQPAQEAAAPPPAAPDTAAIRTAINAAADEFETHLTGGHASAVAGLFTEDATAVFYGFPTTVGRPAIESLYTGLLGAMKVTEFNVNVMDVGAPDSDRATALGTAYEAADSSGKLRRTWYRWAASYRRGEDGQLRLSYLIAFPDSMK